MPESEPHSQSDHAASEFYATCQSAMRQWPETLLNGKAPASLSDAESWVRRARELLAQTHNTDDQALLNLFIVRAQMHIGQLKSDSLRCFYS